MDESELRLAKGAIELIVKWRKEVRRQCSAFQWPPPKGVSPEDQIPPEAKIYALCAKELHEVLAFATIPPNEAAAIDVMMEASKSEHDGHKRAVFEQVLRSYRFTLFGMRSDRELMYGEEPGTKKDEPQKGGE
jgi:hypothetical protein